MIKAPSVKEFRHKAELPLLFVAGSLTFSAVIIVIWRSTFGLNVPTWASGALVGFLLPIIAMAITQRWFYWSRISNGVEVSENQLPELFEVYKELGTTMGFTADSGISALPRLYVINGNGTMNAYASKCQLSTGYVVIYSDLLDVIYENNDFEIAKFILAHELGHIKCGHVNTWRLIFSPISSLVFLHKSISRAQEYTADRVAGYYALEGAHGLMALYAGKHIYKRISRDAYFESVEKHRNGFWLAISNILADHAVGFRRMHAVKQMQESGWNIHGRMR